ncbi:hypothetical protein [Dactylosporangium sp. NPDC051541]|uniref:hypothetical protein n=1 Tax=Dactylosporangium sp. NPDC051541 TaxID=3363977 RepID=UPI00378B6BCF
MARLDITLGRPELFLVQQTAVRCDYAKLGELLTTGLSGPHDRIERVRVAADTLTEWTFADLPRGLDDWCRSGDPTAFVVRGAVEINRAWAVRGKLRAAHTTPAQHQGFNEILGVAKRYCEAAAEADPSDAAPWLFLLSIARGRPVGSAEVHRLRNELEGRAPQSFVGHRHAIAALGPQWGGTMEHVDAAVAAWTAAPRPGSPLPALVFPAFVQRWWSHGHRADFTREPQLRAQAHEASERMPMRPCETPDEYLAHNHAAAYYGLARDPKRANAHFKLLHGVVTEYPWRDLRATAPIRTEVPLFRGRRLKALLGLR